MDNAATLTFPFPPLPTVAGDAYATEPAASGEGAAALPKSTDQSLLERTARGDRDAFTELYRRYERPVFALLLRLGGRRALAEEWLQDTFTRVWLAASSHDPARGAVRPWVYSIALNTARTELSRRRHRALHVSLDETGIELADGASAEPVLAERLDEDRRARALHEALQELPDFMREAIALRCSRELSFAEMAEVTGAPVGTLKSRFHRAVAALREAVARREGRSR